MASSRCFFVDLSEVGPGVQQQQQQAQQQQVQAQQAQNQQGKEHTNLLMVRKPGTPTKRVYGNSNFGEENKVLRGNCMKDGVAKNKAFKSVLTEPKLPHRLQKRLASFPGRPSPEQIMLKEQQVVQKRERLIQAKVKDAKEHKGKCEEVRERKKEYAKNMILIGNTVPSIQREITSVKLPKRLQSRMSELQACASAHLAQQMEKEEMAASRRRNSLTEKVDTQRSHLARVQQRLRAKTTTQRFAPWNIPTFLPDSLKERLSVFRRPTSEAILRKEKQAATRREVFLESRTQALKSRNYQVLRVQEANQSFKANKIDFVSEPLKDAKAQVQLPARLAKRAELLQPSWTAEKILAKEAAAEARRLSAIERKAAAARLHGAKVTKRKTAKHTRARFETSQLSKSLPPRLIARLASFRAPTTEALLANERNVALRGKIILAARSHRAASKSVQVQTVKALKASFNENMVLETSSREGAIQAVPLPKRLEERLRSLKAKYARKHTETLQEKLERVCSKHQSNLAAITTKCGEHNEKVKRLSCAKRLQPRFSNNAAPSFLPEKLKDRMASIRHRTPDAIIRKNEKAAVRAKVAREAKAARARAHLARVAAGVALVKSLAENGIEIVSEAPTPVKLPKALEQRLDSLKSKSTFSAQGHFDKQDAAYLRRALQVGASCRFAKLHNACKVAPRVLRNTTQGRFQEIPDFLPRALKQRLAQITRRTPAAILRKNERADAKRKLHLAAIQQAITGTLLRGNAARELKADLKENEIDLSGKVTNIAALLPPRLARRLTATATSSSTAEEVLAKEARVAENRRASIKKISRRARAHSRVVNERVTQKETVERFQGSFVADFVPSHLKAKLQTYRRGTTQHILNKLSRAACKAQKNVATVAFKARQHSFYVEAVGRRHHTYRESMQMLTKNNTKPIKLPARLERRLSELEAKMPKSSELLAREARAAHSKAKMLRERKVKLTGRNRRVSRVCQEKATMPRFPEEKIQDAPLPARLKTRLMSLRTPTRETIEGKQRRAERRRARSIEAKVDSAAKHAEYVAKVSSLKKEFERNNLHFLGLDDDRVESPVVPKGLRKTLDAHAKKFSSPYDSPEAIQEKLSAVNNQREAFLSERVDGCRQHSDKVREVLARHRHSVDVECKEEVPETNE